MIFRTEFRILDDEDPREKVRKRIADFFGEIGKIVASKTNALPGPKTPIHFQIVSWREIRFWCNPLGQDGEPLLYPRYIIDGEFSIVPMNIVGPHGNLEIDKNTLQKE